ncbi:hypothetical protein [Enterobacter hormaechei]|uniref:hypothetical protein n=1 Tax=Enterobacter hormaechei TaxID=158836 RepID=UPI001BD5C233|nr:hypothetical protein [Enterobacter hormaechei]
MSAIQAVKSFFGIGISSQFPKVVRMHEKKRSLFDMIVFPCIDLCDPMQATLFMKAAKEMQERMTGHYCRVDICSINEIIELAGMTLWGRSAEAHEWLHKLHCVRFRDMHPDIAVQVPHRINMVFANGDYQYPWEAAQ